jgi:dihydrofolate reductase
MRKIIVEEWISLDGYASDRDGQLNFFASKVRSSYSARQTFLDSVDCILFGRQTYQQFARLWPERPVQDDGLAQKINQTRKVVFSNTLTEAPWGSWPPVEIVSGDVIKNLQDLKAAPGKSIVLWGSITLVQAFLPENLIDEFHLHVCPALTGGGRKLFDPMIVPQSLTLTETQQFENGIVLLRYSTS